MKLLGSLKEAVKILFKAISTPAGGEAASGTDVNLYTKTGSSGRLFRQNATNEDEIVTIAETQTLTNKTFTDPTLAITGAANEVAIFDGSDNLSSETQLDKTRGGTGISSTATFPASGTVVTRAAAEELSNKTLDDPLLKVNTGVSKIDAASAGSVDVGTSTATSVNIGKTGVTTTIKGDLQVDGTTTTVNSATLDVTDANITVNNGGNQAAADDIAGLTVEMSDATDVTMLYDKDLSSRWKAGDAGSEIELANVSSAQTLTNKTLTAPEVGTSLTVLDQGSVDFREDSGSGTNVAKLRAPATLAADYTLTLPVDDGGANEALISDGSGNLSFQPVTIAGTGLTSDDATAGSGSGNLTIDSGKTHFHPHITISTGDTYTINGRFLSENATVDGTLIVNGTSRIF